MTEPREPKLPEDFYYLKGFLLGLSQRLKLLTKAHGLAELMEYPSYISEAIKDIEIILSTWKETL